MIMPWLLASTASACATLAWVAAADAAPTFSARQSGAVLPLMRLERASRDVDDKVKVDGKASLLQGDHLLSTVRAHIGGPEDEPLEHQMAQLAKETYYVNASAEPVAGWKVEAQWSTDSFWVRGTDYLALWRRDNMCALVFAPTNQLENWTSLAQDHVDSRDCSLSKVHKGFLNEFQEMVGSEHWGTTFVPTMTSSECASGLLAVGHGFGGAVATIYAACAAKQKHLKESGIAIPALFVNGVVHKKDYFANLPPTSGLYTFGAPGLSHEQIESTSAKDGSFAGARFYLEDDAVFDGTPFSGSASGWIHPKLAAVRLKRENSGWVNRIEFLADTDSALKEPASEKYADASLHSADKYVDRIQVAPVLSGISRPGSSAMTAEEHRGHPTSTLTSTFYGVAGSGKGLPESEEAGEHMYVEPEKEPGNQTGDRSAAASLCIGGAVVVLHAVKDLF
mmetsp:Transcript_70887/g.122816  ORF Transcript_70887/g.122816 Transcript_70887/m.122816 type:complete len:451 (-) Transcript_70887:33-1385(-)